MTTFLLERISLPMSPTLAFLLFYTVPALSWWSRHARRAALRGTDLLRGTVRRWLGITDASEDREDRRG
ncbi:hypothetical protein [Streptomyces sp. NPDC053069]|uniref:hypothetical protein n=1 Tax=Streptomyces sp. NPDC053069 TaxID=3365695 RepID=UPI0037CF8F51